uniref:Uncharacterized protein n=1 Tax=Chromera velia CCMP2878 TaxID=1169474 RepID=A0A0G4HGR0_9ALVE|eukprot:Cvel_6763.t1-p1 / transcript=Cvel_6763.t1 / gene=Cvel_6763 / organism=Chromera_velia_CCMP2878 / gene_product=hypothetical protein / transcript_product=hypothetical protein / location=Cvel_scaffold339:57931-64518(+) / protein_length=241 / sequence_SO=supercontig / SO=protein_coding / is_pseudo=false
MVGKIMITAAHRSRTVSCEEAIPHKQIFKGVTPTGTPAFKTISSTIGAHPGAPASDPHKKKRGWKQEKVQRPRAQDARSDVGSDGDPEDREDASERAVGWEGKWTFWDSVDWTVEAWDDLDIPTDRHIDPRLRPALAAVIEEIIDRREDEDIIKAGRAWKALAYFPSIFFCKDRRGGHASLSVRQWRIKAFWEGDFETLVRSLHEDVVRMRERQKKGQERRGRRSMQQRTEDDLASKQRQV